MSEVKEGSKSERTLQDVHAEYSNLCTRAGHIQYQVNVLTADLSVINEQLKSLNFEAAKLSAKSTEEGKKVEENA